MISKLFPIKTITRSYSRKVNLGNYQSVDFFASRTHNFYEDVSTEEVSEKSEELYLACVEEVEAEVSKIKGPTEIEFVNEELDKEYQDIIQK